MKSKCERFIVVFAAIFSLSRLAMFADSGQGILIYMEPPVLPLKLAQAIPFSSYHRTSVEYGNLTLANGQKKEIHNPGILGIFPYPPSIVDRNSAADLPDLERKGKEVMERYPNVRGPIESVLGKWRSAVEIAAKQIAAAPPEPAAMAPIRLLVNGTLYTGVTLEAVKGDNAKISHTDGIALIPIVSLSKSQIALLNSTTASTHIDPFWADKKKLLEQTK